MLRCGLIPEKLGVVKIYVTKKDLRSREESTETHPHRKDLGLGSECAVV